MDDLRFCLLIHPLPMHIRQSHVVVSRIFGCKIGSHGLDAPYTVSERLLQLTKLCGDVVLVTPCSVPCFLHDRLSDSLLAARAPFTLLVSLAGLPSARSSYTDHRLVPSTLVSPRPDLGARSTTDPPWRGAATIAAPQSPLNTAWASTGLWPPNNSRGG